jgi:hypothetical protein
MKVTKRTQLAAIADVLSERRRQIEVENWTPAHDDEHDYGQMADAAACYALHAAGTPTEHYERFWPWSRSWWKPKDKRSDLVRAAALIIAEIERLDRAPVYREETPEERDEDGRR